MADNPTPPALPVDAIRELLSNDGDRCRFCSMPSHLGRELHAGYCHVERARAQLTALLASAEEGRKDTERLDFMQREGERRQCWTQCDIMPKGTLGREQWGRERWRFVGQGLPNNTAGKTLREALDAARTPDPAREEQTNG